MQNRYFIGLTLPHELTQKIRSLQYTNYTGDLMMQPLIPHITLIHPNALMTLSPMHFVPLVRELTADMLPMEVTLTGLSWFDKRVLHISVESPALMRLEQRLVGLLPQDVRAQYYVGRTFAPHVTLAQAKPYQKLSQELETIYDGELGPLLPYSFAAERLTEFTWFKPRHYKTRLI